MAATFKRIKTSDISMAGSLLYTAPSNTKVVIIGFVISNKSANQIKIMVSVGGIQIIGTGTPVPSGSALSVLDGKLVLEAGDQILAYCDQAASADSFISLLEMT